MTNKTIKEVSRPATKAATSATAGRPVSAGKPAASGKTRRSVGSTPTRNLHGHVVHELGQRIVGGELRPGELLPREETLADQMEVSRTALREAMKVLSAKDAPTVLEKPEGEAVTPPAGLPTVKDNDKGIPEISVEGVAAPTALVSQDLIKGTGPEAMGRADEGTTSAVLLYIF